MTRVSQKQLIKTGTIPDSNDGGLTSGIVSVSHLRHSLSRTRFFIQSRPMCGKDCANRGYNMSARMIPTVAIAVVAFCFSDVAFAADGGRSPYTQRPTQRTATWSRSANAAKMPLHTISWKQKAARRLPADGDPYADPAAPYKANRLSSRPAQPIINIPGQTTVLTRQVIDDKNATTLRDALRTTPGVTIGR